MNQKALQEEITKELLAIKQEIELQVPEYIRQGCSELKADQISHQKKCLGGSKLKSDAHFIQRLIECLLSHLLRMKKLHLQSTNINPSNPIYLGQLITISMFYYEDKVIKSYSLLEELTKQINQQIHLYFEGQKERLKQIKQKELQLLNFIKTTKIEQTQVEPTIQNFNKCYCHSQNGLYLSMKQKLTCSPIFQCKVCTLSYHGHCLQITTVIQIFICPHCTLLQINPMNKVIESIVSSTFQQFLSLKNEKYFLFNCPNKHRGTQIEIRCLRLDGKDGLNEITWPDYGELYVNGKMCKQFNPLVLNYSLKKRKDESINITDCVKFDEQNRITLIENKPTEEQRKQYRIQQQCTYFIGIFAVAELTAKELLIDIKQYRRNYISVDDSFKLFKDQCGKDLKIASVKLSLLCPISLQLMNTPARGRYCSHLQCFDLENFVMFMGQQTEGKSWKCPICKLKCFQFLIDDYQQIIVDCIRDNVLPVQEVELDENGEIKDTKLRLMCQTEVYDQSTIKKLVKIGSD